MAKISKGLQIGIEAKIKYFPILDALGNKYESIRRSGLNDMQKGMSEDQIEKLYQSKYNIQWAWADSLATEINQTFSQLTTAKKLRIEKITEQIKKKKANAKKTLTTLTKIKIPTKKQELIASGLKSKINKIISLQKELKELKNKNRLHICFGSRKLFKAQYNLKENGYKNHDEWLIDWKKKRGGRFYSIGKSTKGGGTMIKVSHLKESNFEAKVQLPRFMWSKWGRELSIPFEVKEDLKRRRKSSLLYALEQQKPITIQIFRREHKTDQWYIHLTTYVQEVPLTTSFENGCIGVDFNRNSVEWAYILKDGNIKEKGKLDFIWKNRSKGQRQARMRDIVVELTKIAFEKQCPISIESLNFSKKKASMSEQSKYCNEMLSNLSTNLFKTTLTSRCKRLGIKLFLVNPAFTSIIGMIKFMSRYGLNSGTAAAMIIARRAMKHSERSPHCLVKPEDRTKHPWSTWNRLARYLKKNKTSRKELFNWKKTLGNFLVSKDAVSKNSIVISKTVLSLSLPVNN